LQDGLNTQTKITT